MALEGDVSESYNFYWKNLIGVSAITMFVSVPAQMFSIFLSSLYPEDGLGSWIISISYTSQLFTALFLPTLLMQNLGYKGTLFTSVGLMVVFTGANLFPSFLTLVPGSIAFGIGWGIYLALAITMVSDLACNYARFTATPTSDTLAVFVGIFHAFKSSALLWINIIATLFLQPEKNDHQPISELGFTCGSQYCNEMQDRNFISHYLNDSKMTMPIPILVSQNTLYLLCASSFTSTVLAVIVAVTVIDFKRGANSKEIDVRSSVLCAVRLLRNPNILLLTIITIGVGIIISSYLADFTKAFVTCSIGIYYVATVSITFGITLVISSVASGCLSKLTNLLCLFILVVPITLILYAAAIFWTPSSGDVIPLHVMGGIWGLVGGSWQTLITAVYGETFQEDREAAISNHRFFVCLGFALGFATSSLLCIKLKMIIMTVWIVCGCIGYILFEIRVRKIKAYTPFEEIKNEN